VKVRNLPVAGTTLEIAEAGNTGQPLLLLHGFTGAKEDLTDWLDPFADLGFHAVAPDHRGHGASGAPTAESAYSLDTFAGDVLALADALDWDRFFLLGHSMGGMIAQTVVLRAPDRVERLVLMDTTYAPVEGVDPAVADLAIGIARSEGIDALADAIAALDGPMASEADARVRAERPGYAEFGERKLRASSPAMYAAMVPEMLQQEDRLDALRALTMPVLVVVGEQDTPFLAASRRMAEAIPGAQLEIIPEAGHSPQFEAPETWWKVVSDFLGTPSAAPPR
jgi:pimeloyl-ACP methyl ester carboxylesterase